MAVSVAATRVDGRVFGLIRVMRPNSARSAPLGSVSLSARFPCRCPEKGSTNQLATPLPNSQPGPKARATFGSWELKVASFLPLGHRHPELPAVVQQVIVVHAEIQ